MTAALDRAAFIKPVAHRGWHGPVTGAVENTAPAFEAALVRGLGVECDLRRTADDKPVVFHDADLGRLIDEAGALAERREADATRLVYRGTTDTILRFEEFLELAGGRGPLLVEIKSDWRPMPTAYLANIAAAASRYQGPLALMSFDPEILIAMRQLAPHVPRGLVSGLDTEGVWAKSGIDAQRAFDLSHLLSWRDVDPSLVAYHVSSLPTPVTRFVRSVFETILYAWTVRTKEQFEHARAWADAPIFEGPLPGR